MIKKYVETSLNKIKKSKFTQDTFWLLGGQFIVGVSGMLLNIIVGYLFSKEDLGIFNQSLAYYMLLSSISTLGLTSATVKFIAETKDSKSTILTNHILIIGISGILLTVIAFLFSNYFSYLFSNIEVANAVEIIVFALPFFAINKIFVAVLSGERLMKYVSFARMFRWISLITLITVISFVSGNFFDIIYSFLIVEIVLSILLILFYWNSFSFKKIKKQQILYSLRFGAKNFLSEIVSFAQDKIDIIIIGYLLSKGDVGLYSLAIVFSKGLLVFATSFMQNINPIISKLWADNEISKIISYFKKIFKTSVYIMTPLIFLASLIFYLIIHFILGEEYYNSFYLYLVFLIGVYFFSLNSWAGGIFIMVDKLDLNLIRVVLILMFSILSLILLTYYFGVLGATIATSMKFLFSSWLLVYMMKKYLGIKIL